MMKERRKIAITTIAGAATRNGLNRENAIHRDAGFSIHHVLIRAERSAAL
jgi:hypothetical protein